MATLNRSNGRWLDKPAFSGRRRLSELAALIVVACFAVGLGGQSHAAPCQAAIAGRSMSLGSSPHGFGIVQGLPPLALAPQEYVITIDDGPNPQTTPQLLDVLSGHCVKATFFLVGRNAAANPELTKAILAQGHTIGSHSFRHPDLAKMTDAEILAEMQRGIDAVEGAAFGGRQADARAPLIRLPGSNNASPRPSANLVELLERQGFTIAGYDLSPQDWRNSPPQESFGRLFQRIRDRGVIVFHDGQPNTVKLLPMALEEFARRGAKIVALAP